MLRDGDEPARLVPGVTASAELFDVLGARPAARTRVSVRVTMCEAPSRWRC